MNFGDAFNMIQTNDGKSYAMRLSSWLTDVMIKVQYPDKHSKMTSPYLYVESRFDKVPWKETMIELFSNSWELIHLDEVKE